jgi:hypothetical protein
MFVFFFVILILSKIWLPDNSVADPDDFLPDPDPTNKISRQFSSGNFLAEICSKYIHEPKSKQENHNVRVFMAFAHTKIVDVGALLSPGSEQKGPDPQHCLTRQQCWENSDI